MLSQKLLNYTTVLSARISSGFKMDFFIADFVKPVTTDCTDRLHFSVPKIPLDLKLSLYGNQVLSGFQKEKLCLTNPIEAAAKSHASIEVYYCTNPKEKDRLKVQITLGSKDFFQMVAELDPDIEASVFLRYEPHMNARRSWKLATVRATKLSRSEKLYMDGCEFYKAPNIHIQILVTFPKEKSISPLSSEVHPPTRRILEEGAFSDVTIVTANGVEIKGHRSFLGVQSPVLAAMFNTDMKESKTGRVDMSDVFEPGIWAFLRYLYYGDLSGPKEDAEIAFQALYASHKYQVAVLEADVMKCLMERKNEDFSVEVAFKLYMFLRNVESESAIQLKTKAIQILIGKMDELRMLQKYRDLYEDPSNSETAMQIFEDFAKTKPLQ